MFLLEALYVVGRHAAVGVRMFPPDRHDLAISEDDLVFTSADVSTERVAGVDRRKAVNLWYDRNVYQRLDNKQEGVIIVVMQRLHVDDLTGHLLKQDGWEVLSLPAIARADEAYTLADARKVGRRLGEAFHPERESRDQLRQLMHQIGAKAFMAQYQQSPYEPGKGNGFHGAHQWLVPVGPEMPGVGDTEMAFLNISQERLVDAEVFQGPSPLPASTPGLRPMTKEEWVGWAGREPCPSA